MFVKRKKDNARCGASSFTNAYDARVPGAPRWSAGNSLVKDSTPHQGATVRGFFTRRPSTKAAHWLLPSAPCPFLPANGCATLAAGILFTGCASIKFSIILHESKVKCNHFPQKSGAKSFVFCAENAAVSPQKGGKDWDYQNRSIFAIILYIWPANSKLTKQSKGTAHEALAKTKTE